MQLEPTIRKVRADSPEAGPYGPDIARRGGRVYVAFDGDKRIAVAATAGEARRLYRKAWADDYHKRDAVERGVGGSKS